MNCYSFIEIFQQHILLCNYTFIRSFLNLKIKKNIPYLYSSNKTVSVEVKLYKEITAELSNSHVLIFMLVNSF